MAKAQDNLTYAATLLIEYAGGHMQTTNLIKALFYLDLYWLRDTGNTFTGARYVALENGPVVDDYKTVLIQPMIDAKLAEVERIELAPNLTQKLLHLRHHPVPPEDPRLESKARAIAGSFGKQLAVALSDYSHKNPGWIQARSRGINHRINMVLALNQVVEEDPWVALPFTAEEAASAELAGQSERKPF